VLATLRPDGRIDAVPAVFAMQDDRLAIPIDRVKPKAGGELQRVRNLRANPAATLLVEAWDRDDWSRLWWVRLRLELVGEAGEASLEQALRARYPQYAGTAFEAVLVFRIVEISGWSAS
jgi:PPOX class probable F420-dependent enzyme